MASPPCCRWAATAAPSRCRSCAPSCWRPPATAGSGWSRCAGARAGCAFGGAPRAAGRLGQAAAGRRCWAPASAPRPRPRAAPSLRPSLWRPQAGEAPGTGLVVNERLVNCPPELAEPLQVGRRRRVVGLLAMHAITLRLPLPPVPACHAQQLWQRPAPAPSQVSATQALPLSAFCPWRGLQESLYGEVAEAAEDEELPKVGCPAQTACLLSPAAAPGTWGGLLLACG